MREIGSPVNPDTINPSSWTPDHHLIAQFSRPSTGPDILEINIETGEAREVLADTLLPEIADAKLARFCDVFVEEGAYSLREARTRASTRSSTAASRC